MVNYATNLMHIYETSIKISIMKEKHLKTNISDQTIIVAHCYCTTDTVLHVFETFANTMDLYKIITFAYLLIFVKLQIIRESNRKAVLKENGVLYR